MTLEEAVYSAVSDAITGDTVAATGLFNTTNQYYVRRLSRQGHGDDRDTHNYPRIEVQFPLDAAEDSFARGSNAVLFRLVVVTQRDGHFPAEDAVCKRVRELLHNQTLNTDPTDWSLNKPTIVRTLRGPISDTEKRKVFEFRIGASRDSGA